MQIFLHLTDGDEIKFHAEPDEWRAAFDKALRRDRAVEVRDTSHGGRLGINPRSVLYWKATPDPPED